MKWIPLILLLVMGQGFVYCENSGSMENKTESKAEFKTLSEIEQRKDNLQRDRFHKRQDVIDNLVKKIQAAWDAGEEKVLETELPILGDECMNLFNIADLPPKAVKKLKRKGYRINSQCESLLKKVQQGSYGKYGKKWMKIKTGAELLLKESKGL